MKMVSIISPNTNSLFIEEILFALDNQSLCGDIYEVLVTGERRSKLALILATLILQLDVERDFLRKDR